MEVGVYQIYSEFNPYPNPICEVKQEKIRILL